MFGRTRAAVAALALVTLLALGGLSLGVWRLSRTAGPTPSREEVGLSSNLYSCGGTRFDPNAPERSGPGPTGDEPARILQATTSRLSGILPDSGWRRAAASSQEVLFVAPGNKTLATYVFVDVLARDSQWQAYSYGDCEPAVPPYVADASFEFGSWIVGHIDKASLSIGIGLQSDYCDATFVGPSIWYDRSNVTVTFWARRITPPAGASPQDCDLMLQRKTSTLTLAEPLGARQLLTGPASAAHPVEATAP